MAKADALAGLAHILIKMFRHIQRRQAKYNATCIEQGWPIALLDFTAVGIGRKFKLSEALTEGHLAKLVSAGLCTRHEMPSSYGMLTVYRLAEQVEAIHYLSD